MKRCVMEAVGQTKKEYRYAEHKKIEHHNGSPTYINIDIGALKKGIELSVSRDEPILCDILLSTFTFIVSGLKC
jgi:hypothetical protein